ncbi:DUF4340 domain-containing protein [Patescibacteria group bacterium]|nr:MAG: DUF4340 domain-containing protein [Patescibacteria group bacterium]
MKKRTIYIFLGIFIVLLAAASFPQWKKYAGFEEKPTVSEAIINLLKISIDKTSRFEIKDSSGEKKFVKKNGAWKVNESEADSEKVKAFFNDLNKAEFKELASKNKSNHPSFDISEDKGIALTIATDSGDNKFIIGKSGANYNSFYINIKGGNNIYLFSGSLRNDLTKDIVDWQKKAEEDKTDETKAE